MRRASVVLLLAFAARVTAAPNASGSINTDFAETAVDTRQTNLARFPLFYPEKRTFFLEGADLFAFGLGLSEPVIPFFSTMAVISSSM